MGPSIRAAPGLFNFLGGPDFIDFIFRPLSVGVGYVMDFRITHANIMESVWNFQYSEKCFKTTYLITKIQVPKISPNAIS